MRALTHREQRTVRIAAAAVVIYLVGFGGVQIWNSFSKKRADYQQLVKEAESLQQEIRPYETKVQRVKKLMESFHMDPAKLNKAALVAEASSGIQKAAQACGVQVGPVREEATRGTAKELATIRIEGNGPVPALMAFLNRLESLGYPLIIDQVQIGAEAASGGRAGGAGPIGPGGPGGPGGPMGAMPAMGPTGPPGMVKLSLTIVILNFDQWKNEGGPNA